MQRPGRIFVIGSRPALVALTALRIGVGVIMLLHGLQKLSNPGAFVQSLAKLGVPMPEVSAWLAIAGETLGGLGLAVGLLTPIAAFGVLCTMLVAVFGVHLEKGLFAAQGGFEYPLVLLLNAAWFMIAGAGPYSLDTLLRARREGSTSEPLAHPVRAAAGAPPQQQSAAIEPVTEAGIESFPASDSPAHHRNHH